MGREDDIDKLIDWAVSQGWSVTTDSKGYRRFYTPAGEYVVRYPKTPSNPRGRLHDVKRALKANGLEVPPPSKTELRRRARQQGKEGQP
ncbi:hypothetical protein ACWGPQ_22010 [Saccharomonospora azurea]